MSEGDVMIVPGRARSMCWVVLSILLVACSNGRGSLDEQAQAPPASPAQGPFSIGGTVTGLTGSGLVLQNNGVDDLSIAADGPFTFATAIATTAAYNVTVLTQPSAQVCNVASGTGAVSASNVTDIVVACAAVPRYAVGGTVSGLPGGGLVLQNNAGDDLAIGADGAYAYETPLVNGSTYGVTVRTQPPRQNCVVENASGTIADANVTYVLVSCMTNRFTIGGNVSGLE